MQRLRDGGLRLALGALERYIGAISLQLSLEWAAVLYGLGVALYFASPFEPPLSLSLAALAVAAMASTRTGVRGEGWAASNLRTLLLATALLAAGAGTAGLRTQMVAAPVIRVETGPHMIEGTVEEIEHRLKGGERLVLGDLDISRLPAARRPERIRLTVRTDHARIRPGDRVRALAILLPPPEPVLPYGYDFARAAWFQRLGAVGFAVGPVEPAAAGEGPRRHGANRLRDRIEARIRTVLPGQNGAVAVALITGLRGGLGDEVQENMRRAGLAHLLAISGLHMGLVTGIVFFAVRALLALWSRLALTWPLKRIAAIAAWTAGLGYLWISGGAVSTQRAFVMASLVLLAIMLSRRAISMRTVALAAFAVLALAPEAILGAGFQMSFAAVIGLIAGFEAYRRHLAERLSPARSLPARAGLYLVLLLAATVIAQAAIAPAEIYHFHRVAVVGALANLAAMPLMSFVVMPLGILALLLMPLGLDYPALAAMGLGIDAILATAEAVSHAPAAVVALPQWPPAAYYLIVVAGLCLALMQGVRARMTALPLLFLAATLIVTTPAPDILVSRERDLYAVRGPDGGYYVSTRRKGRFARQVWRESLASDDLRRWDELEAMVSERGGAPPLGCGPLGCLYSVPESDVRVAFVTSRTAFEEDCRRADIVISALRAPAACRARAIVVDGGAAAQPGAAIVRARGGDILVTTALERRGQRPWVEAQQRPGAALSR